MKWGAQAEWFASLAAIGQPPRAWLERTDVLHHLVGVFEAFFDLSPSRAVHMGGEGFIPLVEIEAYCRMTGIDGPGERTDFMRMIRAMDGEWLRARSPVAPPDQSPGGGAIGMPPNPDPSAGAGGTKPRP